MYYTDLIVSAAGHDGHAHAVSAGYASEIAGRNAAEAFLFDVLQQEAQPGGLFAFCDI